MDNFKPEFTRQQMLKLYEECLVEHEKTGYKENLRELCRTDLFFLLFIGCNRKDINRDWLYARCCEVQQQPDGYLDLWFRAGYKSTILTFGKTIQDILCDSEITVGIFSHTKSIARAFLAQIKREFEYNEFLQDLFPEVLWKNPSKEAPIWSLESGIVCKRKGNPKEQTVKRMD